MMPLLLYLLFFLYTKAADKLFEIRNGPKFGHLICVELAANVQMRYPKESSVTEPNLVVCVQEDTNN